MLAYLNRHDSAPLLIGVPAAGSGSGSDEFVTEAESMGVGVELVTTGLWGR